MPYGDPVGAEIDPTNAEGRLNRPRRCVCGDTGAFNWG